MEWSKLLICTKLKAAELDAVLSELMKDGRIMIRPEEMRGQSSCYPARIEIGGETLA